MEEIGVMGVLVQERAQLGPRVQEVITGYGEIIIGRVGMPVNHKENGIINLTLQGSTERMERLAADLKDLPGVSVGWTLLPCQPCAEFVSHA